MRKTSPLLIAASLVLTGPLLAQTAAKPAAPKKPAAPAAAPASPAAPGSGPTKEQIEDAAFDLRVFASAITSDKVEGPVKDKLFECAYKNTFEKISETITKAIEQNSDRKIDKRSPEQVLLVMAGVCGYRPTAPAAGAPAPGPAKPAPAAPAKPGTQSGR